MQNDKELSFRIYSARAAQKPNRLELEDGEIVGLPNLFLGILLDGILEQNRAGESPIIVGWESDIPFAAGGLLAMGGCSAHFSNCLYAELCNAVLLKAKRPARPTFISAMPFARIPSAVVPPTHVHGCAQQRRTSMDPSQRATQQIFGQKQLKNCSISSFSLI
jgi:hypothetical protein